MLSVATVLLCLPIALKPPSIGDKIADAAIAQTSWGTRYDAAYVKLSYPGGDVPKSQGVCTDVVIRSLRTVGFDLQKLIHEDAKRNPRAYPRIQRLDRNIDHRRCPNQVAFFGRFGQKLSVESIRPEAFLPGDFVFWKLNNGLDHVGVVTGRKTGKRPWVVHNLGGTSHEDALTTWRIVGHYRFPKR